MANDNFITELNGLAKSSAHPPYYIYCSTPYRYVRENCLLYNAGDRDHVRIFYSFHFELENSSIILRIKYISLL